MRTFSYLMLMLAVASALVAIAFTLWGHNAAPETGPSTIHISLGLIALSLPAFWVIGKVFPKPPR